MDHVLDVDPDDIADKAFALQDAGDLSAAAHEFARAADLFHFERQYGMAADMAQRSETCRSVARRITRRTAA